MPTINLYPKQYDFVLAEESEILFSRSIGSRKDVRSLLQDCNGRSLRSSEQLSGMVRKVNSSIEGSTLTTMFRVLENIFPKGKGPDGKPAYEHLKVEQRILFKRSR